MIYSFSKGSTNIMFKSPSPKEIWGTGDYPIPGYGEGEYPPIKQNYEKKSKKVFLAKLYMFFVFLGVILTRNIIGHIELITEVLDFEKM